MHRAKDVFAPIGGLDRPLFPILCIESNADGLFCNEAREPVSFANNRITHHPDPSELPHPFRLLSPIPESSFEFGCEAQKTQRLNADYVTSILGVYGVYLRDDLIRRCSPKAGREIVNIQPSWRL